MKRIVLLLLFTLSLHTANGQRYHNHTVYFENMDGFSGYVKFKTVYTSSPTQVSANSGEMLITGYDVSEEEITALNKAGLQLKRYQGTFSPAKFSFDVTGRAYIVTPMDHRALENSNFRISNTLGDYSTPNFDEKAKQASKKWSENNKETYWERLGGFRAEKVTTLYLSELKNEINSILADYRNDMRAFDVAINSGTTNATAFNFEGAESSLADAKERSNDSNEHRTKISELEKLIAAKKKEKADQDKKEKEEAEKKAKEEAEKKSKEGQKDKKETESKADKDEEAEDKEEKSESKSSKKSYIPKTASQMYAEMKTMAERSPGMMNDPNFRQRLRHMEVDANREQQTIRDYRSGVQYANSAAISQYNASNRKIDTYTKAVGDVTDAATSLVSSIIAAGEEKKRREQAQRDAVHRSNIQARENNKDYIDATKKARRDYIETIEKRIGQNYVDFAALYAKTMSFVAKDYIYNQKDTEHEVHSLRTYLALDSDGKYGLLADDGDLIYPPQFDVAFPVILQKETPKPGLISLWKEENPDKNFIAVKAEGRWGILRGNGSVLFPIKYDYIFFLPNGNMILKEGNNYTFKVQGSLIINDQVIKDGYSVDKNTISQLFPKGLIPVSVGREGHLSGSQSAIENFHKGYQNNRIIKAYTYNAKGTCEIVDLDGNIKWSGTENVLTQNNIQFYNAEISMYKDIREAYNFYYSVSGSWNSITVFNGTNMVKISPLTHKYLGIMNPNTGKQSIVNTDGKTLYAPDEYEIFLAAISPEGLTPVQRKGYIDQTGSLKIPYSNYFSGSYPSSDRLFMGPFENGYAVVQVGVEKSYPVYNAIDVQGNKIFAQNYKNKESLYYSLGWHFSEGANSFSKDKAKAFYYYLIAAEMGSSGAMNNIGVMYMIGDYVAYDVDEAINWYKKAAESGNNMAAKNLAYHYKETNIIESVKWFEQAAKSYPETHYDLAKIYSTNEEVKSVSKAVEWFKKVASRYQNDANQKAEANYYIGTVYEYQSDANLRNSAKDYFSKAAQSGHKLAIAKLNKKVKNNEIATFALDENNTAYLVSIISYDFKKTTYHGPYKLFDNNGQLREVRRYVNGKLIGEAKIYDKTGVEVIVPLKYDNVEHFSDGLAMVQLNNKWGFIDKTGKEVTPLKYDNTWDFSNGLAKVKINNKWGLIDKTGKEVTPLKYDATWAFPDDIVGVKLNDKWGFIDKMGKEMIPLKYDATLGFSDGIAGVKLNDKWGVIDKTGKEVTPLKYDDMEIFVDGLAMVKLNDKYGFIDKTGKEVIPLKYDFVGGFSDGLARVKLNDKWSFIDKTGKEVIPLKHDGAWGFSDGLAEVILNNKYGFIDKTGKEVTPLKYDDAFAFSDGLAKVKLNDKWGFIDKTGKEVTPLKYDATWAFSDGLAAVKLNDKWGFIDKMGKEVTPLKYDTTWGFSDGLAVVKLNDKWGFIDSTGKEVIPLIYDATWAFSDGLAAVKLNDKWRFIDKTGEEVVPLKYDYDDVRSFSNGLAKVKINNKWGFIDKTGKEVIYR